MNQTIVNEKKLTTAREVSPFSIRGRIRGITVLTLLSMLGLTGIIMSTQVAFAAGCTSAKSGNWSASATWAPGCTGVVGTGGSNKTPGPADDVTIKQGTTVTLNRTGDTIASLSLQAGNNPAVLTHASTNTLTVSGAATINQPTGNVTSAWNINGGTATVNGLLSTTGTDTHARITKIVLTTGTLNTNGGITFTGTTATNKVIDMSGGAGTINMKGNLTPASSTLTSSSTSVFNYNDGTAAQVWKAFQAGSYSNLYFNNTGSTGATLSAVITSSNVTGNIKVQSGTLTQTGSLTIGMAASKTFEVDNGATFKMTGTGGFPTGTTPVYTLQPTSTVRYLQTSSTTIVATTYGNLVIIASAEGTTFNWTNAQTTTAAGDVSCSQNGASYTTTVSPGATTALDFNGGLTIFTGCTFTAPASGNSFTIAGDFLVNGPFMHNSGTVTLDRSSFTQFLNPGFSGLPFNNLTHSGAGTVLVVFNDLVVDGTLTNSAGTFNTNGKNLTATTTFALSGGIFTGSAGNVTVGDMTVTNSPTLTAPSGTFTVNGNWTMTSGATFTSNSGTVTFNSGNTATVTGPTTFYNLAITNTTAKEVDFSMVGSDIIDVTNALTVTGHTGDLIKLYSTNPGTKWHFHPTGTASVDHADVKDGGCEAGSITISPTNSTDSGNNDACWSF